MISNSSNSPVKSILESSFSLRIHPHSNTCPDLLTKKVISAWKKEGAYTVFQAGSFDLLTINHILGLTYTKALAAMHILNTKELTGDNIKEVHTLIASPKIKLMIAMDTNEKVMHYKSNREEKGGCPKPILDWRMRAAMLALQSTPSLSDGLRGHLVDFITMHGPESCCVCQDGCCTSYNNSKMAVLLQPDLVVVNAASLDTVNEIETFRSLGLFPNTAIEYIREEDNQYIDKLLNGPVKTTEIIRRARS